MSLFSGTRVTDRDIETGIQKRVRAIVLQLWTGRIDPTDANRQLVDLLVRAVNAMTRVQAREGVKR